MPIAARDCVGAVPANSVFCCTAVVTGVRALPFTAMLQIQAKNPEEDPA
ncbi:MAG: hypothetical protein ABI870_05315 [Rhodanobacter sp.]